MKRGQRRRGPIEAYLDTNAISSLLPRNDGQVVHAADLRRRLRAARRYRQVTMLSSVVTIQELMGVAENDWGRYSRLVRLVFQFVGMNFIEDVRELWVREYLLGRAARGRERLSSAELVGNLRRQSLQRELVADVMKDVRAFQARFKEEEESRREGVRARFAEHLQPGEDPAQAVRKWWSDAEEHIASWARTTLGTMLDLRGVSHPDLSNYNVRALPTLWNFHAYKLARIEMNVGENRRIETSDPADAHHYTLGAYATVFVSDDRAMRDTCRAIPHASVDPIALSIFARSSLPFAV